MAPAEPERTTASVGPKCTGGPRLRSPTLSTIRTGDVEIADEFDKTSDPKTKNGQTIAIRRSSCEKVLTIWSPGEQWNVYLQPLDIRTSPCTVS